MPTLGSILVSMTLELKRVMETYTPDKSKLYNPLLSL